MRYLPADHLRAPRVPGREKSPQLKSSWCSRMDLSASIFPIRGLPFIGLRQFDRLPCGYLRLRLRFAQLFELSVSLCSAVAKKLPWAVWSPRRPICLWAIYGLTAYGSGFAPVRFARLWTACFWLTSCPDPAVQSLVKGRRILSLLFLSVMIAPRASSSPCLETIA